MKHKFLILLFIVLFTTLKAEQTVNNQAIQPKANENSKPEQIIKEIENINKTIQGSVWITRYTNYNVYQNLKEELAANEFQLKTQKQNNLDKNILIKKNKTLKEQISMLKEYETTPFSTILQVPEIESPPRITNPIALVSGFSYIKKLRADRDEFYRHINDLSDLITKLQQKQELLDTIIKIPNFKTYKQELSQTRSQISEFSAAAEIAATTFSVYDKKVDELSTITKNEITSQLFSMANIAFFIITSIVISFLFKIIAKRTIKDKERIYTFNKFINFINFSLIIIILLFAYIENVNYLVTVLGFASAGIAIAMKDMFMSMLGWAVIVFGGTFHVGDRIKVSHQGNNFVGDIVDISLLRMTIFEDITMTTYKENRRSGRIVFIPNNYIFTELISNYTHSGLKTVWDGIDILITFDSNHKKATHLAASIATKYSKGITDSARRQMNKLRDQYSLKNPLVEPRIFSMVEPYGINISVWYMTDSYATLRLRSTISTEIIEAFNAESDIVIAYPAQNIYTDKRIKTKTPSTIKEMEPNT